MGNFAVLLPISGPWAGASGGFLRDGVSRSQKESPEPPEACGDTSGCGLGGRRGLSHGAVPELSNHRLIPQEMAEGGCSSEPKP